MKRGYRSPRNVCRSMMERGAIITPAMVYHNHPGISVPEAKRALQSLIKLGIATDAGNGHYEITERYRV